MKLMLICIISVLITTHCFAYGKVSRNSEGVSLMQLIVNPEQYHGKTVRVIGVSRIEFEGNGIWFSKEHYQHGVYKNSLWIVPDYEALGATPEDLKKYNGKYVLMEGVFNKDRHGHMSLNSGTLEKVTRFMLWEELEKQANNRAIDAHD